jgi:hypothetical protein
VSKKLTLSIYTVNEEGRMEIILEMGMCLAARCKRKENEKYKIAEIWSASPRHVSKTGGREGLLQVIRA